MEPWLSSTRSVPRISLERREASALEVLDRVLDKGIVVDYGARVLMVGVDLLTNIDARVVVASMDTHLRYAEPIRKSGLLARADLSVQELAADIRRRIEEADRAATQKPNRLKNLKRV
jgi:hypothetical protein